MTAASPQPRQRNSWRQAMHALVRPWPEHGLEHALGEPSNGQITLTAQLMLSRPQTVPDAHGQPLFWESLQSAIDSIRGQELDSLKVGLSFFSKEPQHG